MQEDIIIIGSGISALTAADYLSKFKNVIIFTKTHITDSNSYLAQGGIASAIADNDTWQSHLLDTLSASANHADVENTKTLVKFGPNYIQDIIEKGMQFDQLDDGNLDMAQEGAHGKRRIVHAGGDATGQLLIKFMLEKLNQRENIQFIEHTTVIDLIMEKNECIGVKVCDPLGHIQKYYSQATILATGGCGALYTSTSNHENLIGDGLAIAYRAGAELIDMEFIQFHPTILFNNGNSCGLVSEAVRGEGAILINQSNEQIMASVHPLGDLAPRDIVAREIFKRTQMDEFIFLDVTRVLNFKERFPTIYANCLNNGIDVDQGLLPIVPGAHFTMGGVKASPTGETSIPRLFAVGEVSCTGVHGANRIASNSLLEGIVFGNLTAKRILKTPPLRLNNMEESNNRALADSNKLELPTVKEIKTNMMRYVGVIRSKSDLLKMKDWLDSFNWRSVHISQLDRSEQNVINMLTVATLITNAALKRTESRGSHYRDDYPTLNKTWTSRRIELTKNTIQIKNFTTSNEAEPYFDQSNTPIKEDLQK